MGHNNDCNAGSFQLPKPVEAFGLEVGISNCQNFINQQNIRIHVDGNRKGKPHIHTGRIRPHRIVNKFFQFGKGNDIMQPGINFLLGQAKNRCIGIDIFPSAHVRMEAGTQFNQAGRQKLQRGTFSAAVVSDQTDCLPFFHLKADAVQNRSLFIAAALTKQQAFLELIALVIVNFKLFRQILYGDRQFILFHYNSSAKCFCNFEKTTCPKSRNKMPSTVAEINVFKFGMAASYRMER